MTEIDKAVALRIAKGLTKAQRELLAWVAAYDTPRDGPLSSPEISRCMGHPGYWARAKLLVLETHGLVHRFAAGQCWNHTPLGLAVAEALKAEAAR